MKPLYLHARNSLEQGKQRAHPKMVIAGKQEIAVSPLKERERSK